MKSKMFLATLMASLMVCSSAFAHGLLERMVNRVDDHAEAAPCCSSTKHGYHDHGCCDLLDVNFRIRIGIPRLGGCQRLGRCHRGGHSHARAHSHSDCCPSDHSHRVGGFRYAGCPDPCACTSRFGGFGQLGRNLHDHCGCDTGCGHGLIRSGWRQGGHLGGCGCEYDPCGRVGLPRFGLLDRGRGLGCGCSGSYNGYHSGAENGHEGESQVLEPPADTSATDNGSAYRVPLTPNVDPSAFVIPNRRAGGR